MPLLAFSEHFEVRLADDEAELRAAQALRYRVFFEEMGATPSAEVRDAGRDFDRFDRLCDHLIVVDKAASSLAASIVGNYRLLLGSTARQHGGFYSADEFDLAPFMRYPGEVMELGRSCIDGRYRNRAVMQLLWQGIAAYVFRHDIAVMFGCASLPGTDPDTLAVPLSYLHHAHRAPDTIRPTALKERYIACDRLPLEAIDAKAAMRELPPLIRGYLRLGGYIGEGAVIDFDFNTIDVCMIVETEQVNARYRQHYERQRPHLSA